VVDACISVTGTERGFIFLRDETRELALRVGRDKAKKPLNPSDFQGSMSVIQDVGKGHQDIIVTNSLADERVSQRQSVVGLDLRTIICLPLRRLPTVGSLETTLTGFVPEVLGVIYLDSRLISQAFSDTDRQVLRSLALEAANVIENARLFTQARAKQQLDQELAVARNIQQALLPKGFKRYPYFNVAGLAIPCREVGGDYYDLIELANERYAFVIADVCGKGVAAALLTALLQGGLAAMLELGQTPDAVARQLNRYLFQHTETERYATFFCGILEADGTFACVNAGHLPPLYLGSGPKPESLSSPGFPLGLFEDATYEIHRRQLQRGETLILHTDGLTEAENTAEEPYGAERLQQVAWQHRGSSAEELAQKVVEDVGGFMRNAPALDDLTLLVVRYEGHP
jgi:serine phosphatase RsbU (regulator of sigma subunit)